MRAKLPRQATGSCDRLPAATPAERDGLMIESFVAALCLGVLAFMSVRANRRLSHRRRLPMQWTFSGSVSWSAPRPLALAFTPVLAAMILVPLSAVTIMATPRPGQEGFVLPVVAVISVGFVVAHAFHLRLIGRTEDTKDG